MRIMYRIVNFDTYPSRIFHLSIVGSVPNISNLSHLARHYLHLAGKTRTFNHTNFICNELGAFPFLKSARHSINRRRS